MFMKRRSFIAVGVATAFNVVTQRFSRPTVGAEFTLNNSSFNVDPSIVDRIAVEFESIEIVPQYLDDNQDISISLQTSLDDGSSVEKTRDISFSNGKTNVLSGSDLPSLIVDGINTDSQYLSGRISVTVNHPDTDPESYSRRYLISKQSTIPTPTVESGSLDNFYNTNIKNPGSATVNQDSVTLKGKDTGSSSGENYAELETPNIDRDALDQITIDFSLSQFGDSSANPADFTFIVYGDNFDRNDNIATFGELGSKGNTGKNLSRSERTVDLSGVSGTGPIRFRAYRSNSGIVENFGGSVEIFNIFES